VSGHPLGGEGVLKVVIQAVAAAAVTLVVPVTCALQIEPGPPMPDGSPDNGPLLGVGAFLLLTPIWVLILSAYFAVAAAALQWLRSLTLTKLLLINLLPAGSLGLAFAHDQSVYGAWHAAQAGASLFGDSIVSFTLGTLAWWALHQRFAGRSSPPAQFAA
jgi:hypothetical protein